MYCVMRVNTRASYNRKNTNTRIADDKLCTKAVESTTRSLESVDDIEGRNGFPTRECEHTNSERTKVKGHIPLSVFSVGDGVTDDVLQEDLQDTTSLLINETRDTLDTATTRETTDSLINSAVHISNTKFAVTGHSKFYTVEA